MKLTRFLATAILLIASASAASAQCDPDAITATYERFLKDYNGTPVQKKMAAETGKEYLNKFGECPGEAEKKIAAFIRSEIDKYETTMLDVACATAVEKTPAKAFELCRPYVVRVPENLRAYLLLSLAGIRRASDASMNEQTVGALRKSLELIKAGKKVDQWIIGGTKDQTVDTLEYYAAFLTMKTSPSEAAATLLRLAHSSASYSRDPNTYYLLARSLHNGEVQKLVAEHNAKCSEKAPTPECEASNSKIEATVDRVIDAYARAVAFGARNPEHASIVAAAKPVLTDLWKSRYSDSGAGLDKFVADILSKPIP